MSELIEPAPLYSTEAEAVILGAILWGDARTVADASLKLKPDDFYLDAHREIFEAFLACHRQNRPIEFTMIVQWLDDNQKLDKAGGRDYIKDLLERYPVPTIVDNCISIVRDRSLKRKIRQTISDILALLQDDEKTYDQVIAEAADRLYAIQRDAEQVSSTTDALSSELARLYAELTSEETRPRAGPFCEYHALDEILKGFRAEHLIILAARPSIGKTTLAINLAVRIARNLTRQHPENPPGVAFFTMEMSPTEVALRTYSMMARIDSQRLFVGNLSRAEVNALTDALARARELPIFLDGSPTLRPEVLKNKLIQLQLKHPIHLVIVDYLQLMSGDKPRENRVQEVSEISKKLKQIAREHKVCVLALSQLSRDIEKRPSREPVLSDLRESGSIEQDADVVMFLYSDDPDYKSIDEAERYFRRRTRDIALEQSLISLRSFIRFNPEKLDRDDFDGHLRMLNYKILELGGELDDSEEEAVPIPGTGISGNGALQQFVILRFKIPLKSLPELKDFIRKSPLELDFLLSRHLMRIKVRVEKNRYGPKGEATLWFRRDYGEFREKEESNP
ncbi:MAG: replicative DNA helicase [bacterium JZ-2024 1]